jgi:hypothetical protein
MICDSEPDETSVNRHIPFNERRGTDVKNGTEVRDLLCPGFYTDHPASIPPSLSSIPAAQYNPPGAPAPSEPDPAIKNPDYLQS